MSSMLPSVTVIIPTFNCSASLVLTIESIINQDYPNLEIIAIDAGSTDHTLEILNSFSQGIRLGGIDNNNFYAMINKGIEMAKGEYINVLYPGDFYIHQHTLLDVMQSAIEEELPDLVYCGTLLRDGRTEVKFLFRKLDLDLLKKGQQPTSLQGCWFKRSVFDKIGLYSTHYHLRGGYEFLCRYALSRKFKTLSLQRALTDYDLRWVTTRSVVSHFFETMQIVFKYFGWIATFEWLGKQKDIHRFIGHWIRHVRIAFLGR